MTNDKKTIDTLVEDIYGLFSKGHCSDHMNLEKLGNDIGVAVDKSLRAVLTERKHGNLRMSNLGKADRQIWYDIKGEAREVLRPNERIKFLFGDILEALLIFLVKEAGHEVSQEQAEVEIAGVLGHLDCEIDGVVVDCKSASPFSFKKFKDGSLANNDPFGYMQQISGYAEARGKDEAAFLAIDKQGGHITTLSVIPMTGTKERIAHLREVVASDTPPEKCYEDQPDGKSGNMKLGTECSYCAFKKKCWADANDGKGLRTFLYSTGPRFLTKVGKLPDVFEITGNEVPDEEA